jgi:predicted DNA binding protein
LPHRTDDEADFFTTSPGYPATTLATRHNYGQSEPQHVTIIAELCLSGEGTSFHRAHQAAPGLELELERSVVPVEGEPVLFLWATGSGYDAFEAALPDDPSIEEFEVVEDAGQSRLYRVVVNTDATVDTASIDRRIGASRLSAKRTHQGAINEMRFTDWEALQAYIDLLREAGLEVSLQSVTPAGRAHRPEQYGLSEKQLEMLRTALDAGYFAVPRDTDLTTLAAELDISEQAASERLRRGLASLLAATVGEMADADADTDAETALPRVLSVDGGSEESGAATSEE